MAGLKIPWDSPTDFVREHALWILGLVPLALAAIKILVVSSGDPQVFNYLIRNLNVVQLVLSIGLPLLPLAGLWLVITYYDKTLSTLRPERAEASFWLTQLVVGGGIAALLTMTLTFAVTTVGLVLLVLGARLISKLIHKRRLAALADDESPPQLRTWRFAPLSFVAVLFIQLLFNSSSSWISNEIVSFQDTNNHPTQKVAQVIEVAEPWTILLVKPTQIRIIETKKIVSREPCATSTSIWSRTVGSLLNKLSPSPGTEPVVCPEVR